MRTKLFALCVLLVLATAGCVKADLRLDVNDDGSGTFTGVVALNADVFNSLGGLTQLDPNAKAASGDICKQILDESKADTNSTGDAKVEPYKDGKFCGVRTTSTFKNIDEALALFTDSSSGSGLGGLENVKLGKEGKGWHFSAQWNPDTTGSDAGANDALTRQMLAGFSFVIRIKLPGGQVDQNADLIENDGTMVWNLDPTQSKSLNAQTDLGAPVVKGKVQTDAGKNVGSSTAAAVGAPGASSGGSSKTWLWIVIGLAAVAAVVVVILVRRNKTVTAPAGAGAALPADPGAAPWVMPPSDMTATAAPLGSTAPMGAAPTATAAAPAAPGAPSPSAPSAAAAAAESSPDQPQWDAARNAYIQYDRTSGQWMQYDQTAGAWKPIDH